MKIPIWFCDYLNEHHVNDMRMREFAWKVYQKGKRDRGMCEYVSISETYGYQTACGNMVLYSQHKYCQFCGKRIKVKEK